MRDAWTEVAKGIGGYYHGSNTQTINSNPINLPVGLNHKASLYLKMAYAVEGYECWTFYCDRTTVSGSNSNNLGEVVVFDIFPGTLDTFYEMGWSGAYQAHPVCQLQLLPATDAVPDKQPRRFPYPAGS